MHTMFSFQVYAKNNLLTVLRSVWVYGSTQLQIDFQLLHLIVKGGISELNWGGML